VVKTFFVILSLILFDLISKMGAVYLIPPLLPQSFGYPFGGIGLFDLGFIHFSLNLVTNKGAAWGMFENYTFVLFLVRFVVACGLIYYSVTSKNLEKYSKVSFILIAAGALGNSLDFLLYGQVIDFIHVRFLDSTFPLFNLADSYISLGALFYLFSVNNSKKVLAT
jgi:signal peptidase II